jgi:hypothetical protein
MTSINSSSGSSRSTRRRCTTRKERNVRRRAAMEVLPRSDLPLQRHRRGRLLLLSSSYRSLSSRKRTSSITHIIIHIVIAITNNCRQLLCCEIRSCTCVAYLGVLVFNNRERRDWRRLKGNTTRCNRDIQQIRSIERCAPHAVGVGQVRSIQWHGTLRIGCHIKEPLSHSMGRDVRSSGCHGLDHSSWKSRSHCRRCLPFDGVATSQSNSAQSERVGL